MRTTDQVSASLIKREVWDAIYNFKPYRTPVTQFFMANKLNRYGSGNPKIEMQEDVLVPHTFTPTDALAGGAATEADVVVGAANMKLFQVGTVVHVADTGESLRVTAIDTANNEVNYAKIGSGNITAAAASATYIILGHTFAEGSDAATAVSTVSTFPYNYLEIKKKAVYMSRTQRTTVNYGGADWTNQRMKATEEFKLDLERMWVFGVRDLVTTTGANIWFSGGLLDSNSIGISDRSQFAGNAFATEAFFFDTYLKNFMAKGSDDKVLYCGSDAIVGINNYQKTKQQTKVAEREYGVNVTSLLTPFGGTIKLVWHPLLEGWYSNWVIGVDRDDYMKYAFLAGNGESSDMQYQTDLQTPSVDAALAQYYMQAGFHLAGGSQGVHRVLYPGA